MEEIKSEIDEVIIFQMITKAGAAKTACFNAIKAAKKGEFVQAEKYIEEANQMFIEAHEFHGELIKQEASGNRVAVSLLLTHAEDILMGAELSKDFALEFIDLYQSRE